MASRKEKEILQSEVAQFYAGKTLLITGAAGFIGTILLEILLRCCPGVRRIYILLRAKKGVLPEDRKEAIFKKELFSKIKEKYSDVLEKVTVISGDISVKNLGMNEDDLRKVVEEVSIVFHIAAETSFTKPLRFTLFQNVFSTYNIIELCRKLKHVDALVYTSTAFSNCNRKIIDEIVYKMNFKAESALETIRKGSDEDLYKLFQQCTPNFPNFYTFSKCLSENLLAETAADLPVSIVRPSIVFCIWRGILPGYFEKGSGFYDIGYGIGKGFIRVMQVNKNLLVDNVPADTVGNIHIVAAWRLATERLPSPYVYNCTLSDIVHCTWGEVFNTQVEVFIKHRLPNSYQTPGLRMCKNSVAYWFHSILDHYVPAIVFDTFLWLSGRKPRLLKLYIFYDKIMSLMLHFKMNEWRFLSANFQSLAFKLNSTDSEMFPVDIHEYTFEDAVNAIPTGCPVYNWANDKKSYEDRIRTTYIRFLLASFIKWTGIGFLIFMCYRILF